MKKVVKIILIMTIVAMIIGIVNVSNAFSFNANLSSNDKLVAGQEVKVTLSLSGIDMDDGIRSIRVSKITVGEEFESVTSANFTSNTFSPTYSNGGLVLMSGNPVTSDVVAVTLTLKVKAGMTANSSTVKFEDIVASAGSNTGNISVGTKTITIKSNESATSGSEPGTTDPSTAQPTKPSTQNGTSQSTGKNTDKGTVSATASKKELPKTGESESVVVMSLILIVSIVGVLSFVRYKKTKRDSE